MHVAFYSPMKPPDHPTPSGDRTMAGLLRDALQRAGHEVTVACRFASYDGCGDPRRQRRLERLGGAFARRLARRWRTESQRRPDLWFTYHLYHKAPDWLGPRISADLDIPYVVAEASHAPKQHHGPWAAGYTAAAAAMARADLICVLNQDDAGCLRPLLSDPDRLAFLDPFVDTQRFATARRERQRHRHALTARAGVVDDRPILLTVAMMRPGAKLQSYRLLADALTRVADLRWRLVVAGDGPAHATVDAALAPVADRVTHLGRLDGEALAAAYAAADLFVWPAIAEAWGMALLEAQAAGVPVVAGRTGGVPQVVADGCTGLLVPIGDAAAFASAVRSLLEDTPRRKAMAAEAAIRAHRHHDIATAAMCLDAVLQPLLSRGARQTMGAPA